MKHDQRFNRWEGSSDPQGGKVLSTSDIYSEVTQVSRESDR